MRALPLAALFEAPHQRPARLGGPQPSAQLIPDPLDAVAQLRDAALQQRHVRRLAPGGIERRQGREGSGASSPETTALEPTPSVALSGGRFRVWDLELVARQVALLLSQSDRLGSLAVQAVKFRSSFHRTSHRAGARSRSWPGPRPLPRPGAPAAAGRGPMWGRACRPRRCERQAG